MVAAESAKAVALNTPNTSGAPVVGSTARASSLWLSRVDVPSVHNSWAIPELLVVAAPAKTDPPPETTTKLMIWPAIGLPFRSVAFATSGEAS